MNFLGNVAIEFYYVIFIKKTKKLSGIQIKCFIIEYVIDRKEPEFWHSMDENPMQHSILGAILEAFLQVKSVSTP